MPHPEGSLKNASQVEAAHDQLMMLRTWGGTTKSRQNQENDSVSNCLETPEKMLWHCDQTTHELDVGSSAKSDCKTIPSQSGPFFDTTLCQRELRLPTAIARTLRPEPSHSHWRWNHHRQNEENPNIIRPHSWHASFEHPKIRVLPASLRVSQSWTQQTWRLANWTVSLNSPTKPQTPTRIDSTVLETCILKIFDKHQLSVCTTLRGVVKPARRACPSSSHVAAASWQRSKATHSASRAVYSYPKTRDTGRCRCSVDIFPRISQVFLPLFQQNTSEHPATRNSLQLSEGLGLKSSKLNTWWFGGCGSSSSNNQHPTTNQYKKKNKEQEKLRETKTGTSLSPRMATHSFHSIWGSWHQPNMEEHVGALGSAELNLWNFNVSSEVSLGRPWDCRGLSFPWVVPSNGQLISYSSHVLLGVPLPTTELSHTASPRSSLSSATHWRLACDRQLIEQWCQDRLLDLAQHTSMYTMYTSSCGLY